MKDLSHLPASIQRLIHHGIGVVCPKRVILFGSRARGDAHPLSDFDIAFEFAPEQESAWVRFLQQVEDIPLTLREVDLVDFARAPQELKSRILAEGSVIHGETTNG